MRATLGLVFAILPLVASAQVVTITEYTSGSACSAIYTTGTSTTTIVQSTVIVTPQPVSDASINGGDSFVIELQPATADRRRQESAPMYLDSTGTTNTDLNQAVRYRILNGTLQSVAGGYVSCDPTDDFKEFSISTTPGSIIETFYSENLIINWDNEAFDNGTTKFYTQARGDGALRLIAYFRGVVEPSWSPVSLVIKPTGSLSIESSSGVVTSSTVPPVASEGSMVLSSAAGTPQSSVPGPPAYSEPQTSFFLTISGSETRTMTSVFSPVQSPPVYSEPSSAQSPPIYSEPPISTLSPPIYSEASVPVSSASIPSSGSSSSVASSISSARSSAASAASSVSSVLSSRVSSAASAITASSIPPSMMSSMMSVMSSSARSSSSTSTTSYPLATGGPTPNGYCGATGNGTFCALPFGGCCSQYDACGNDNEYCGIGCQTQYGNCDPLPILPPSYSATAPQTMTTLASSASSSLSSSSTSTTSYPSATGGVTPNGYCGATGNGTFCASPFGGCCSQYDACGNDNEYCGTGCQSQYGICDPVPVGPPSYSATAPQSMSSSSAAPLSTISSVELPPIFSEPQTTSTAETSSSSSIAVVPSYQDPATSSALSSSDVAPSSVEPTTSSASTSSAAIVPSYVEPTITSSPASSSSAAPSGTRSFILASPTPCDFGDVPGYGQDDDYCTVNLTQAMRIYAVESVQVFPSCNGLLSIGEGTKAFEPLDMPDERVVRNDGTMNSFFAPFWDDLGVEGGAPQEDGSYGPTNNGIWYEETATGVTFEYDLSRSGETDNSFHWTVAYTFATPGVAVYTYYQLGNAADNGISAGVGMQGVEEGGGNLGVTYSLAQARITPGLKITCDSVASTCVATA
ncbi:unnamed protein product [Zymoseptoria tritici ST99CH_1E4]|uniref:Chitin-binding type-1 domain-containing protein n=1 Tax=Zymoseptoria tritici ST99CH_1E4 TaxID=1276532 RepID=A0A2H1H389_ZYMTR|nr:unnamed protein product [Zymoseptoria tritici ST99CH_1E4]